MSPERDNELRELAAAYLRLFLRQTSDESDRWSGMEISSIIEETPEEALALARHFAAIAPSDAALAYFGAGPLEELLEQHGPRIIAPLLKEAAGSPNLRTALRAVWRTDRIAPIVWEQLHKAMREE